jgi:hypothetical protein
LRKIGRSGENKQNNEEENGMRRRKTIPTWLQIRIGREEYSRSQENDSQGIKDIKYFEDHWDELVDQYPNEYVAIYCEEVIEFAKDEQELRDMLEARCVNSSRPFIEWVYVDA